MTATSAPPTPAAPSPQHRISRTSRDATTGTSLAVVVVVLLAIYPFVGSAGTQRTLIEILTFLSLAQMWNLLAGYAGLITIGQQAFVGVGAYTLLAAAELNGLDPFLAVLLAGPLCALLSVPVALFAFRLKGGYFAIGTWVIAEVFRLIALEIGPLEAGNVQSLTRRNALSGYDIETLRDIIYWSSLALAAGATLVVVMVLRSRMGLALRAVRDAETCARGVGIDVTRVRLLVWMLATGWAGMTGALIHLNSQSVTAPDAFSVLLWTALVIFIVVIGGVGSTAGPILGVIVFWLVSDKLTDWFELDDPWRFIILGVLAALFAVLAPRGLFGLIQRWRPVQLFPERRRLVGPGVEA
jgi:branched-chain amino acid transport system permease protein